MANELVKLSHKVPTLSLVQLIPLLEVSAFLLLKFFHVKKCPCEVIECNLCYLFNLLDLMHRQVARWILLDVHCRVSIVVILHTLVTNGCMATLAVRFTNDLWVLKTLQDSRGVTNKS